MGIRAAEACAFLAAAACALVFSPVAVADAPAAWQADPAHTGFAQGATLKPPLGRRWVRRDLGDGLGYPVMAEGKVFVTTGASLYALAQSSGATLWSRSVKAEGVAYDAGRLFVVDKSGVLQALSPGTGEPLWTTPLTQDATGIISPPSPSGDFVYVSSGEGTFGVRQADGIVVWTQESAVGRVPPAVGQDRVYTAAGCDVRALQPTVGVQIWHHAGGCRESTYAGLAASAQIYAGTNGAGVVLDPFAGDQVDTYVGGSPPALANGVGYFVDGTGVFARSEPSGVIKWRNAIENPPAMAPLVAQGHVYVLDERGKLMALAADTGATAWQESLQIGTPLYSSDENSIWAGMAAAGDTLVVPSRGRLTAFTPGTDTPGIDDPDKPSGAGASLTLTPSRKLTVFGRSIQLTGRLEGPDGGFSGAVEIQADPWPYGAWEHLKTVKSEYGSFATKVRPDRNTRYRAVHAGTNPALVSPTRQVFSNFFEHFTVRGRSSRSVSVRITLRGPSDLKLAGRRIYVYHYRRHGRSALRIGALRLHRHGRGAVTHAALRTPPLRRSDLFFTCLRERRDDGFGKPLRSLRLCGRRRL